MKQVNNNLIYIINIDAVSSSTHIQNRILDKRTSITQMRSIPFMIAKLNIHIQDQTLTSTALQFSHSRPQFTKIPVYRWTSISRPRTRRPVPE